MHYYGQRSQGQGGGQGPVSGGQRTTYHEVTLIKSVTRNSCFEAPVKMNRYNIHHLLVLDQGELKGMITNRDPGCFTSLYIP